jgi:hypothetical protein
MSQVPYTVALVVDPNFGEQLVSLSARLHVWAIASPMNRASAETIWRNNADQSQSIEFGITTFTVDLGDSPENWCKGILGAVDLHHGEYSHTPPVSALEVYGLSFSESLRSDFANFGFTAFQPTPYGFYASTPAA